MGHLGSTARGQTPLTLAANSGAAASVRAAGPRGIGRRRGKADAARSAPRTKFTCVLLKPARHRGGGRSEERRTASRRSVSRGLTPNDQGAPRAPRTLAPPRPSVPRTRTASCGAAGTKTQAVELPAD
jgi:hypothetical protein